MPGETWPARPGPVPALGAIAVAVLLVGLAVLVLRRAAPCPPDADAFSRLARGLGLSRAERRLVHRLALERGTTPAALLLSEWALRRAIDDFAPQGARPAGPAGSLLGKVAGSRV